MMNAERTARNGEQRQRTAGNGKQRQETANNGKQRQGTANNDKERLTTIRNGGRPCAEALPLCWGLMMLFASLNRQPT
jgi:hypothetical protein